MTGKRRAGRGPAEPPPQRPQSSPHESMVIAPVLSRRQARAERKRQRRRRFGFAGGSAIVIGAIVVIALIAFGVNKAVTSGGGPTRSQTTVLFQITGTDGNALTSALLAHDTGDNSGSEVLIPSRVITDVCGYNTLNFGDILTKPDGETASRQALSAMLSNITIDGSWIVSTTQLAKLIDALGGVTVDVDVDVVQHTGGGGGRVLVATGSQRHLTGTQAVEYATYTASSNEDAALQLARLQQVIDATVLALPPSATGIAAQLRSLGATGESTLGATKLSSFLLGFAAAERGTGTLLPTDLPTTIIDSGGAPSYSVDTTNADALVKSHLSASLPADAGTHRTTVYLLNGVGSPGLVATTCTKLAAKNITYAGSRNAATFNHPTSSIVVSNANIPLGYKVADALRLPHSDVLRTSQTQTIADVIVTLGGDYRP
jgi:hypothetical protein